MRDKDLSGRGLSATLLRRARAQAGLTQTRLAELAGTTQSAIATPGYELTNEDAAQTANGGASATDNDAVTDGADLAILLDAWGGCGSN